MPEVNDFQLQYYESVIESVLCGTVALNSELVIASMNPAAEQILGLKIQESVGFPLPRLLSPWLGPEGTQKLETNLLSVLHRRLTISDELVLGKSVVALKASPLAAPQQPVMGVMLVFEDITERKRAEEHIQQQRDELQRWYTVTLTRETRTLDLKYEVNALLRRLNEVVRYPSAQ